MEYVITDVHSGFTSTSAKKECIIARHIGVMKYNSVHSPFFFKVTLCFLDESFHNFATVTLAIPAHWRIAKGFFFFF